MAPSQGVSETLSLLCSAGLQAAFYLQRYVAQVDALEAEAKERVGCFTTPHSPWTSVFILHHLDMCL